MFPVLLPFARTHPHSAAPKFNVLGYAIRTLNRIKFILPTLVIRQMINAVVFCVRP